MDLIKSRGLVVFIVVLLIVTIIGSINTKKYDENNVKVEKEYVSMNTKNHN